MLKVVPMTITDAREYVRQWHKHHKPPVGGLFAAGVANEAGIVVGVAIAARPIARNSMDGFTIEVVRVAVNRDADARNACSMLYGAIRKAATALGYRRVLTYTLQSEIGASLRASGFRATGITQPAEGWMSHPKTALTPGLLAIMQGKEPEQAYPTERKIRWEWP
jgi:hypothetical protein